MAERREFLRALSSLPVAALAGSAEAQQQDEGNGAGLKTVSVPVVAASSVPSKIPFNPEIEGAVDPVISLLGNSQITNWQAVSKAVQEELGKHKDSEEVKVWMSTFSNSFSSHSRGIVIDAHKNLLRNSDFGNRYRYEPQLYESSLRDAAGKLDRCLAYRNEMGEDEVAGINAGLSYLAFIKLRPLQLDLIRKSSNADLASMEQSNSQSVMKIYDNFWEQKKWGRTDEIEVSALKQGAQGSLSESGLIFGKELERTRLLEEQFRIQSEMQIKRFKRFLSPGSSSNFSERYLRLLRLLEEDLSDAYCALFSAAQGIASLFNTPKTSFKNFALNAHTRVALLIPNLDKEGAIDLWLEDFQRKPSKEKNLPTDSVDVLDALVLWCRGVMRELDRRSQYESEFTVSIPLTILDPKGGTLTTETGVIPEFTLNYGSLPGFMNDKPLRVVGFGLSVQHNDRDQVPVQDAYPLYPHAKQAVLNNSNGWGNTEQEPYDAQSAAARELIGYRVARVTATVETPRQQVGTDQYRRPLAILSNVRLSGGMSGDLEPELLYDSPFRNFNPFNDGWKIRLEQSTHLPMDVDPKAADSWSWVNGIVLHLRIRGMF